MSKTHKKADASAAMDPSTNSTSNTFSILLRERQASEAQMQIQSLPYHATTFVVPPHLSPSQVLRLQQIQYQRLQIKMARARVNAHDPGAISSVSSILQRLQEQNTIASHTIASPIASATYRYSQQASSSHDQLLQIYKQQPQAFRHQALMTEASKSAAVAYLAEPTSAFPTPGISLTKSSMVEYTGSRIPVIQVLTKEPRKVSRKKPKDMPRRALSAYNFFFKEERQRILEAIPHTDENEASTTGGSGYRRRNPHGKIGFESLARLIGQRWQDVGPEQVQYYKALSDADKVRHQTEMDAYHKARTTDSSINVKRKADFDDEDDTTTDSLLRGRSLKETKLALDIFAELS